jgi:hypothetical protein
MHKNMQAARDAADCLGSSSWSTTKKPSSALVRNRFHEVTKMYGEKS